MTMDEREKAIKGLECCVFPVSKGFPYQSHIADRSCEVIGCPYQGDCDQLLLDSLELLKSQELPDVKPEKLEERTTKWLDQMTAEERLEEIAAVLNDWDGYRTAKGLAGLINEVWAYALYPVKAQEPGWISVKDRLPENVANRVIVWVKDAEIYGHIGFGHYEKYKGQEIWFNLINNEAFEIRGQTVTHWLQLPEPPKEEEHGILG